MAETPLKIVILDGHTVNPGDLTWAPVEALGECAIYPRSSGEEVLQRVRSAEAILTNKVRIGADVMDSAPRLRYIGVTATGYNVVDIQAARERKIVVTNIPSYSTASVAQATMALLLELTNRVGYHDQSVHSGSWSRCADFCYWSYPIVELAGLHLGIIGFGTIGRAVAKIASAMGMSILVQSRSGKEHSAASEELEYCDRETLLRKADVVTLHCPLNETTAGMIHRDTIAWMKASAYLLNTARGGLIVEADLADALNSGAIAGAAVDVLSTEPPDPKNPLLHAKNCIITPHHGWASRATRIRLMEQVAANLKAFLAMHPVNVVSR